MRMHRKEQSDNQSKAYSPYRKQMIQIAKMANYQPIASIPGLNVGFNFTVAEDGLLKKKRKSEIIQQQRNSPKQQKRNQRQQTKLPKIGKNNKLQHHPTNTSQNYQRILTLDTRQDTQELLIMNSRAMSPKPPTSPKSIKQDIKKGRPSIRYKLKALEQSAYSQESQSDDEYSTNATPGPGSYSVNDSDFFNRSRPVSNFSFGSRAQRFQSHVETYTSQPFSHSKETIPQQNQEEKIKRRKHYVTRKKKITPFLSSSVNKQPLFKKEEVPGPVDYHPRFGIEEQLIRKIQRNFKGSFGICEQRFKQKARQSHLGPGCYSPQLKFEENQENGSFFFKSEKKRL